MDSANGSLYLVFLLPLVAVVGLALNLFIRARGGRSFHLRLKGFGIDLTVETKGGADNAPHIEKE